MYLAGQEYLMTCSNEQHVPGLICSADEFPKISWPGYVVNSLHLIAQGFVLYSFVYSAQSSSHGMCGTAQGPLKAKRSNRNMEYNIVHPKSKPTMQLRSQPG